jgi:L-lactate dehydrogenase complex protein LldF
MPYMSSVFENEFRSSATKLTADLRHRALIRASLKGYEKNRDEKRARFQSWESARQAAAETKWEAINHLDSYLSKFADNLAKRGAKVFWASTAEDARNYILNLAREKQAKTIIKSKTMTSEEIHLNDALAKAGYEVVESDLGEYIVQLRAPNWLNRPAAKSCLSGWQMALITRAKPTSVGVNTR